MNLRDRTKIKETQGIEKFQLDLIEDQSKPSYKIKVEGRDKQKAIADFFKIPINENFKEHFKEVTNGQGNEKNKILTLHSSSLLAFLCFYNISEEPLKIQIEIKPNEIIEYNFTEVFFEIENNVEGNNDPHPSSIDIVLFDPEKKALLFLESKFTEPISGSTVTLNREIYKILLKDINFKYPNQIDKNKLSFKTNIDKKERILYGEGIKQMIAHYLGIINGPKKNKVNKFQKRYQERYEKATTLILGTILLKDERKRFFDDSEKEMLNKYIDLHKDLMTGLKNIKIKEFDNKKEIILLISPFFYEEIFKNYQLDKLVKKFYGFEDSSFI